MKNRTSILLISLFTLAIACKKSDKSTVVVPPVTNPTVNPYYFKFSFRGKNYNFKDSVAQYMPFYVNEVGGYQDSLFLIWPAVGLRLSWPFDDTVKESDLTALVGKTLYFNDTTVHPTISFDPGTTSMVWYSEDTANTNFNVKISKVTYLKKDVALTTNIKTYVITGTCSAVLRLGDTLSTLTNGEFNFVVSRRDY